MPRWLRVAVPLAVASVAAWLLLGGRADSAEAARVEATVRAWVAAWEAQDLDPFLAPLARDYRDEGGYLTYGAMRQIHETDLFRDDHLLVANLRDLDVRVDGDRAWVSADVGPTVSSADGREATILGDASAADPTPIVLELAREPGTEAWKIVRSRGLVRGRGSYW